MQHRFDASILAKELPGVGISLFSTLDSTNTEAKRQLANGESLPRLIAAQTQTAGRGRMGRSFYSPSQTGLYFSYLYSPDRPLASAVRVTSAAAVAVMEAICEVTGLQCDIKWVNDLYYGGKKICGILCESAVCDGKTGIIVGIGINLCTVDFPDELAQKAGSLGVETDPNRLLLAVLSHLRAYLEHPDDHSWLAAYRAHSRVIGKPIRWVEAGLTHRGTAIGIDCEGGLEVQAEDGTLCTLRTGEISVTTEP